MDDLGTGLRPGDAHYRAFVGPPEDYDLIAANAFCLLSSRGLRAHHRVADIGCGSLRIGRLLIPFLNATMYTGIEPNRWLVQEGIAKEVGDDLIALREPQFSFRADARDIEDDSQDWCLAQSIFSHCGSDLLNAWLRDASRILRTGGQLVATFVPGGEDSTPSGWHYPECTSFTWETVSRSCEEANLAPTQLDWTHPRQRWFAATKVGSPTGVNVV